MPDRRASVRTRRVAFAIVRCTAVLVPASRRAGWRREWESELDNAFRMGSARVALRRSVLCLPDAVHVRLLARRDAPLEPRRRGGATGLIGDVRLAVRGLARDPLFALIATLTFGLGIGVNATAFAVADAVLFRDLPFVHPDRLVAVALEPGASVSKATLTALRERIRAFESLAGWSGWGFTWTDPEQAEVVVGARATTDLFEVLGIRPFRGRTFVLEDGRPGAQPVAVVSYGFWRTRLGGSADAVGRTLRLNDRPHTVVGVMPPQFEFPASDAQLWTPLEMDPAISEDWTAGYLQLIARLRSGRDPDAAAADVRTAAASMRADEPGAFAAGFGDDATVRVLRDALNGARTLPLLALLITAFAILLTACVNVAGLLIARATERDGEIAVRAALGGSRRRIARQLLVESVVLACGGAFVGLLLAYFGIVLARELLPAGIAGAGRVALDVRVVAAATACAGLAGIGFGLAPAIHAARIAPSRSLTQRAATASAPRRRALRAFVVIQTALAVVLVAAAGLSLRSLSRLLAQPTGFDAKGAVTAVVLPTPTRYESDDALRAYWRRVFGALAANPAIRSAGGIHLLPFGGSDWNPELVVEDRPTAPDERRPDVGWRVVSPGWFEAAGIALRQGRRFTEADREDAPAVAIVNETLARRIWPNESALGKRVRTFFEGRDGWVEIIGVVEDTRDVALERAFRLQLYRPLAQTPMSSMVVLVRGADESATAAALRHTLAEVDAAVPVVDVRPFDDVISRSVAGERTVARLLAAFGALALMLGAVGVYGVTAFIVGRRASELGVRSALGARSSTLLAMVLGETLRDAIVGIVIGIVLAMVAGRVVASRLFGVESWEPAVLIGTAILLGITAILAAFLPAVRAARTDPMRTLRRG